MPKRVYSSLVQRLAAHPGETYPLHVGDTWMEPAEGCRMEDLTVAEYPGMHRYPPPQGTPLLLDAIAGWTRDRGLGSVEREQILVAASGSHALSVAITTLVAPGEEVLVLAPYWPLSAGMVRIAGATPVPVSILPLEHAEDLSRALAEATTERTVAVYVNSPHNPSGRVLSADWLAAVAAHARKNDLWVFSDEVYVHYAFEGEHVPLRPMAPERTLTVHSFSKAYGMAGNRCGYLLGPAEVLAHLQKVAIHTAYSAPHASQLAAARALAGPGDEWAAQAARSYAHTGRTAAERLGVAAPQGSTFLFLPVADRIDERGVSGLLSDCVDQGLLVAPGTSFGPFPGHIRLCYTSVEPERALRGIDVLAGILD
jgi:N-succinyldiaminopimelate aminotransferase